MSLVCVLHLFTVSFSQELLLGNGRISEAKQLVENCITANNTGAPIDRTFCKQFHLILWEQASQANEKSEHNEAVLWYNYSLSLFPINGEKDKNIAKLQVKMYVMWCR